MTVSPVWVTCAFHALVIFWSPGYVNVAVQPAHALVPVLLSVTFAVKPPGHAFGVYVTAQPPGGDVPAAVVTVTVADRADRLPAVSRAYTAKVYVVDGVRPVIVAEFVVGLATMVSVVPFTSTTS